MDQDQNYYAHAKLLLTGEYWVLHGARALGIPLSVGQSLNVRHRRSYDPHLTWTAKDHRGQVWFKEQFEFWHFKPLSKNPTPEAFVLQSILQEARVHNKHFLRDEVDVEVETKTGFPREWGLGSSSSLIVAIAQWARVSPFSLQEKVFGGSGADVAISQAQGPIVFERQGKSVAWRPVVFNPSFKNQLYFLYLGRKQSTLEAIKEFAPSASEAPFEVMRVSGLTEEILRCQDLGRFTELLSDHDHLVSRAIGMPSLMQSRFGDFHGYVKGLGAWGGDFALVASSLEHGEVRNYFESRGYSTLIAFCEMSLPSAESEMTMTAGM